MNSISIRQLLVLKKKKNFLGNPSVYCSVSQTFLPKEKSSLKWPVPIISSFTHSFTKYLLCIFHALEMQ